MALVHKHEELADRWTRLTLQLFDKCVEVTHALLSKFMEKRAKEARRRLPELRDQVPSAARAVDRLSTIGEHAFYLFIEFVPISNDQHPSVRLVFQNPLGQQNHDDAFAAALCVPDDSSLVSFDV